MIIAVDGPAASGKGTIARALADHFGLPHLDTGALYRGVALAMLRAGDDPADAVQAAGHAERFPEGLLHDDALRDERTGAAASILSAHDDVRAALLARQRAFAARAGGAVLDGRDIGTVIAPNADVKIYVLASVDARAERRAKELAMRGQLASPSEVAADLIARDARDTARAASPLKPAPDAHILDTTGLSIEDAVTTAIDVVNAAH